MGHIWVIYGLYMGYLREYTVVAALVGTLQSYKRKYILLDIR
jgi:hypothetical protein